MQQRAGELAGLGDAEGCGGGGGRRGQGVSGARGRVRRVVAGVRSVARSSRASARTRTRAGGRRAAGGKRQEREDKRGLLLTGPPRFSHGHRHGHSRSRPPSHTRRKKHNTLHIDMFAGESIINCNLSSLAVLDPVDQFMLPVDSHTSLIPRSHSRIYAAVVTKAVGHDATRCYPRGNLSRQRSGLPGAGPRSSRYRPPSLRLRRIVHATLASS